MDISFFYRCGEQPFQPLNRTWSIYQLGFSPVTVVGKTHKLGQIPLDLPPSLAVFPVIVRQPGSVPEIFRQLTAQQNQNDQRQWC